MSTPNPEAVVKVGMKSIIATGVLMLTVLAPVAPAQEREVASPIVLACVDKKGVLVSAEIFQSSNFPDIDAAALKVAQAAKFTPGSNAMGLKKRKSCVKFKVKFVIRDGEPVPAES
jgi:TonB family protein